MIDKNSKLIHKYYADKGFRNAEVSVRIDNDSILKQAVNVTFIVDRKRKIKIGEINFTGNEEFSDKRLRRTFKKTHQKSLNFFRGAKFNEEDFENDKELLLDFYNSKGFRNANIVADSIYAINDKRMGITLDISEGNKYYIRNVSWIGNSVYETDELARMFGVEKGSIYDKKSMYKRLASAPTTIRTNRPSPISTKIRATSPRRSTRPKSSSAKTRSTWRSAYSKANNSPSTMSAFRAICGSTTR